MAGIKREEKEIYRQMVKYAGGQSRFILLALAAGAVCAGCGVAGSELLRYVVDGLISGSLTDIKHVVMLCAGVLTAGAASSWAAQYASGSVATKMLQQVKDDAVAHITRITDDVNRVSSFVQNDLILVITNPFLLLFYMVYLLLLNPPLLLISIVPTALCLPLGASLTTKFKAGSKAYMQYSADVISSSADMIGGMEVVKSYCLSGALLEDYRESVGKMTDKAIGNDKNQYKGRAFYILSGALSSILCLVVGGWLCLQGKLTIGSLVAFFSLLPKMVEIINDMANRVFNSKVAMAAAERVLEILHTPAEPTGTAVSGQEEAPAIEFRDVWFSYEEGAPVLEGVSFTVPRGKTVAVVGGSGGERFASVRGAGPARLHRPGHLKGRAYAASGRGHFGAGCAGGSRCTKGAGAAGRGAYHFGGGT